MSSGWGNPRLKHPYLDAEKIANIRQIRDYKCGHAWENQEMGYPIPLDWVVAKMDGPFKNQLKSWKL